jgi:hypothetical protein
MRTAFDGSEYRNCNTQTLAVSVRHIPAYPTPEEMIRPPLRTEILLSKTPHLLIVGLRGTFADRMPGLFAAENVPATPYVGIDRLIAPQASSARIFSIEG